MAYRAGAEALHQINILLPDLAAVSYALDSYRAADQSVNNYYISTSINNLNFNVQKILIYIIQPHSHATEMTILPKCLFRALSRARIDNFTFENLKNSRRTCSFRIRFNCTLAQQDKATNNKQSRKPIYNTARLIVGAR